jgi:hypothetical protein
MLIDNTGVVLLVLQALLLIYQARVVFGFIAKESSPTTRNLVMLRGVRNIGAIALIMVSTFLSMMRMEVQYGIIAAVAWVFFWGGVVILMELFTRHRSG